MSNGGLEVWANAALGSVTSGGTNAPASGTVQTWTVAVTSPFAVASSSASPATYFFAADPAAPGEVFLVTVAPGGTGTESWTVTRGAAGTTPTTHAAGFLVIQAMSSATLSSLQTPVQLGLEPTTDLTGAGDSLNIEGLLALTGYVLLGPGTFYVNSTITPDSRQVLAGSGPGSVIQAGSGFSGSYLVVNKTPATTYQITVRDLTLVPGTVSGGSISGPGGVQLDNTGLSNPSTVIGDTLHLVENVIVLNSGGDGYHLDNHVREARLTNCKAYRCQGYGFYLGDASGAGSGLTDSHFTDCTSGFTGNHGWNVLGSNNQLNNCKAFQAGNNFYSGSTGTTECGFELNGAQCNINTLTNCQAQQNGLHGFDLQSCVAVAIVGCQADSNGAGASVTTGVGINVNASTNCTITDNVGKQQLTPGNQIWGVQVAGGCKGTVVRDNPISGTSGTFTSSSGNINRGTATLVAGTVTVSNNSIQTGQAVLLTTQTPGGTVGAPYINGITAGTSFVIKSTSSTDTSTVYWELVY